MFTASQAVVLVRAAGRDYTRTTVSEVMDGVATASGMPFHADTGLHTRVPGSVWLEAENSENLAACAAQVDMQSAEESMHALRNATPEQLAAVATELAAAASALP